jgi:hypothetical protein
MTDKAYPMSTGQLSIIWVLLAASMTPKYCAVPFSSHLWSVFLVASINPTDFCFQSRVNAHGVSKENQKSTLNSAGFLSSP